MSGVVVAPDTPVTVVFVCKASGDVIHRDDTTAELIGGTITRLTYMFNADISGGVRWRHPRTGRTYPRGISWHVEFVHLRAIIADPAAAAMRYAELTSRCSSCNRPLEQKRSVAEGMGPVCARRFFD